MEEKKKKQDEKENIEGTTEEKKEKPVGAEKKEEVEKKEEKVEEKEVKKKTGGKKEIIKKDKAVVDGRDLAMSTKQAAAICRFIKGRKIEDAAGLLGRVLRKEVFVPMKGEIPHRKGKKKIKSGRYPVKASGIFIKLLKSLAANSNVVGLENPYIEKAIANIASRPYRRFGSSRFKRTHVYLEARELKDSDSSQKSKKISDARELKEKEGGGDNRGKNKEGGKK